MHLETLRKELMRIARQDAPSDAVPFAFEQRVLHALRQSHRPDPLFEWFDGLLRAARGAMVITALAVCVHLVLPSSAQLADDAVQDHELLDTALLAGIPETEDPSSPPTP